jgi:hypothetical protein
VEVRACGIKHSPANPYKRPPLKFNAVYVSEPNPPEGAEALEWMLLTTEPIVTNEEIEQVICGYEKRWLIEEFHRVWKTGCKTKERRLRSPGNLKRILAILSFIAVRIMQLRSGFEARSTKHEEYSTGSASGNRNGLPVIRERSPFKFGTNQDLKGDNDGSFCKAITFGMGL